MTKKIIITGSALSVAAAAGYTVYKTLFKEPGHPATWGPSQTLEYYQERGYFPTGVSKKVRNQVHLRINAAKKAAQVVLPDVEKHLKEKAQEAVTEIMDTVPVPVKDEKKTVFDSLPEEAVVHRIHTSDKNAEEGSIKAFSPAYRKLIQKALKEAGKDENYRLYLDGSVYGIGSRGSGILKTGESSFVHVYDLKNIKKLSDKLEDSTKTS